MPRNLLITLITVSVISPLVRGGFTRNNPKCTARNTAYLNPSKPQFPQEAVRCVDITGMGRGLVLQDDWPLRDADTLYADHMHLTAINRTLFGRMPGLQTVDLSGNGIRKVPKALGALLPQLRTLHLSKNRVRIPKRRPLTKSATLSTLMLSHNKIRAIQTVTFTRLPALRTLYLDSNSIKVVTAKMFTRLKELRCLHLGNNLLKSVPAKMSLPKSLEVYIVKGNKLEGRQAKDKA